MERDGDGALNNELNFAAVSRTIACSTTGVSEQEQADIEFIDETASNGVNGEEEEGRGDSGEGGGEGDEEEGGEGGRRRHRSLESTRGTWRRVQPTSVLFQYQLRHGPCVQFS